jgi:hypothetical protein
MAFLPRLPRLSERGWQRQVLELAGMFGWKHWHDAAVNNRLTCRNRSVTGCQGTLVCDTCGTPAKPVRNAPGFPDLLLVRDQTLIVVELKSDRGRETPEQKEWLTAFRRVVRVVVRTWRPKDLDEVVRFLR